MLIGAYGSFWRADEIVWHPGHGSKGKFRLLGRIGTNHGNLRIADFRQQKGIYLLTETLVPITSALPGNRVSASDCRTICTTSTKICGIGFAGLALGEC